MMSDVPYGAFLSGGVDSAAIVAAMKLARSRAADHLHDRLPRARRRARRARARGGDGARSIGTDHHDTAMHETDFLAELARCMPRLEEPCGIPSAPALLQLSRFAAERREGRARRARAPTSPTAATAATRPPRCSGRSSSSRPRRPPRRPRSPAPCRAPRAPAALAHLLGGRGDAARLLRLVEITDAPTRAALVGPGAEAEAASASTAARAILADVPGRGLLDQALYLDTHMFLPDGILLCNDKMSMAAGLELRVPFLDVELMRFVERIPASRRVRPRRPKRLHRRAMRALLPPEVDEPQEARLRHPLRRLAARLARRARWSAATRPARRSPS